MERSMAAGGMDDLQDLQGAESCSTALVCAHDWVNYFMITFISIQTID